MSTPCGQGQQHSLRAVIWRDRPANVAAAFTTRADGNIATHVGDDAAAVASNRRQLRTRLNLPSEPVWLHQVHGRRVLQLQSPAAAGAAPSEADAAVAAGTGIVCAVQVADCLPVLFASVDGSAVGAAHAGWRGLAGGILEETVQALKVAPERLSAWIGPGICQRHFEVGGEVRELFLAASSAADGAFTANDRGRWQCDLPRLAADRLRALGVGAVEIAAECTFSDRERFFSYRRDGVCGRMAALIWRPAEACDDPDYDDPGRGLKGRDTP